ncbi:MAG: FAD-dependent oxidoreductase [Planctomycetaceae bacterium]|nr:FAD-dependent oxidoreductase [Planctomycetaceae bacterium]
MRIAVVGSGISGLVAAHFLVDRHEVVVFEASDRLGGHTHTHQLEVEGRKYAVDSGFIVFNDWTYPNFLKLLERLQVPWQDSDMGFSVRSEVSGLEYAGKSLDTLFAQRRNALRPSFLGMVRDILRFHREAPRLLANSEAGPGPSLSEYLRAGRYGERFAEDYLLPMGAAIWSASRAQMLAFPARYFVQFFANHGMLSVDERPTWRVVKGGSSSYLGPISRGFAKGVRTTSPVQSIRRYPGGVGIRVRGQDEERFDAVVVAAHADEALQLLADPSDAERSVLGAFGYQENEAVLHTDSSLLPRNKKTWAAWNYHQLGVGPEARVAVSYWMNRLQSIDGPTQFLVTLNRGDAVDPSKVLRRMTYHHPVYTHAAVEAQTRWREVNGVQHTWFAGAYWGYGFHEDGVKSGLRVAADFGVTPW